MLKANDLKNVSLSNFCHYIYLEGIYLLALQILLVILNQEKMLTLQLLFNKLILKTKKVIKLQALLLNCALCYTDRKVKLLSKAHLKDNIVSPQKLYVFIFLLGIVKLFLNL